jgi:hypothetical protein
MSKTDIVKECRTSGVNYNLSNEDILKKLEAWDSQYGIEISDVAHNKMLVTFISLPADLEELAKDIYDFCPDVIEQHFGVMDEMVDMMDETGQELDKETAELVDGVDFEDERFGEILLQKSLAFTKSVSLWWD